MSQFNSRDSEAFAQTLDQLIAFLSYRDPIYKVIGMKINSLSFEEIKMEQATGLIEGMLWLLYQSISKEYNRFNCEIGAVAKAGVGCANVLYHADLLPDPSY